VRRLNQKNGCSILREGGRERKEETAEIGITRNEKPVLLLLTLKVTFALEADIGVHR